MQNPFDNEQRVALRETIRGFVEKEISPFAFEWDEAGAVPWELHEKLGALGIFGFGIDEEYGGLGFDDPFRCAVVSEEIMRDLAARQIVEGPRDKERTDSLGAARQAFFGFVGNLRKATNAGANINTNTF